jgi:nucleoside-diphosphate-sugar epimerase
MTSSKTHTEHFLVTGAAGFIGSAVTTLLLERGARVTGVDNLCATYDVRLKLLRLGRLLERPGFSFRCLDVEDFDALQPIGSPGGGRPYDGIFHLAARAGVRTSALNPWVYVRTNIIGTLNILELARQNGVPQLVVASSSSVYGNAGEGASSEAGAADQPLSPYAATKKGAEAICHSYHHLFGLNISLLRYFTVYGPYGRPDMALFRFVHWISTGQPVVIYGDGLQQRDFTYIADIARGTVAAVRLPGFHIINLGSDHPIQVLDAVHKIEAALGKSGKLDFRPAHGADVARTWAEIGSARQLLHWRPETPFDSGIEQLTRWYTQNRTALAGLEYASE